MFAAILIVVATGLAGARSDVGHTDVRGRASRAGALVAEAGSCAPHRARQGPHSLHRRVPAVRLCVAWRSESRGHSRGRRPHSRELPPTTPRCMRLRWVSCSLDGVRPRADHLPAGAARAGPVSRGDSMRRSCCSNVSLVVRLAGDAAGRVRLDARRRPPQRAGDRGVPARDRRGRRPRDIGAPQKGHGGITPGAFPVSRAAIRISPSAARAFPGTRD